VILEFASYHLHCLIGKNGDKEVAIASIFLAVIDRAHAGFKLKYDFPSLVDLVWVWRMNMTPEDWPDCGQGTIISFMLWHYVLIFKKRNLLFPTTLGPRRLKKSSFPAVLDSGMLNMGQDLVRLCRNGVACRIDCE